MSGVELDNCTNLKAISIELCQFQDRARNAASLVVIAILAGCIGGAGNYLQHRELQLSVKVGSSRKLDENELQNRITSNYKVESRSFFALGVLASLLVPLFLHLIGSNITTDTISKPGNLLVYAGFCVIAALSSKRFISQVAEKALAKANQSEESTKQVDQRVHELEAELREKELHSEKHLSNVNYAHSFCNEAKAHLVQYAMHEADPERKNTNKDTLNDAISALERSISYVETARAYGLLANTYSRLSKSEKNKSTQHLESALTACRKSISVNSNIDADAEALADCLYNSVCYGVRLDLELDKLYEYVDEIVKQPDVGGVIKSLSELLVDADIQGCSKSADVIRYINDQLKRLTK
ncbi:YEATS-associated helix-containing protein [Shewanella sp. GutDb-MelDb]|uniref:YEATS-associated helix-containing protein n=1 Tax=Shewanella sp. GutDb-MelDb TaxID=2058316 RepID=UPI000C7C96DE|nr:YEATS-associated helix-containing protein [Shewanella sp. GutDb-MelDb]PKG58008.1 hypothetical protein CXF82_06780 [Shewanella sp. GutDb-MelDb]